MPGRCQTPRLGSGTGVVDEPESVGSVGLGVEGEGEPKVGGSELNSFGISEVVDGEEEETARLWLVMLELVVHGSELASFGASEVVAGVVRSVSLMLAKSPPSHPKW